MRLLVAKCKHDVEHNFDTSSSYLKNLQGWDDLSTRQDKQLSMAMFKTLNVFSPNIQRTCLLTVTLDII